MKITATRQVMSLYDSERMNSLHFLNVHSTNTKPCQNMLLTDFISLTDAYGEIELGCLSCSQIAICVYSHPWNKQSHRLCNKQKSKIFYVSPNRHDQQLTLIVCA